MKQMVVISITALTIGLVIAMGSIGAKAAPPLKGDVLGSFFFHACPAGTAPEAVCLHDDVVGNLPTWVGLRGVSKSFSKRTHSVQTLAFRFESRESSSP